MPCPRLRRKLECGKQLIGSLITLKFSKEFYSPLKNRQIMTETERDRDFERWQLEKQLVAAKLSLFLLTSSILFLGCVQVRASWLGVFTSLMGIVSCIVGFLYFKNKYTKKIKILRRKAQNRRSRWIESSNYC